MEAITDYDCGISYTPGKANVMADALSRKSYCNNLMVQQAQPLLYEKLCKMNLHMVPQGSLNTLVLEPTLERAIKSAQAKDAEVDQMKRELAFEKARDFSIAEDGTLYFRDRLVAEHQKPAGLLQPLPIPVWKWDKVQMDLITGLPKSQKNQDAILVVVDQLSKVAHFLPVKEMITASQSADLYMSRIVSFHDIPKEISSDRGILFTSNFWEIFQEAMGTQITWSTAYHPQSQGQVERVNQVLEDMLRPYVISFGKKWEESLPYAEFSYNNSYQASLKMAPFEGTRRFGVKGKLAPRHIGPFRILTRHEYVAYKLEMSPQFSHIHDVFHVSQLRHCFKDPHRAVDHEMLELQEDLSYKEHPIRILDQAERRTRQKVTKFLKVQWSNHTEDEATWERENRLWEEYPDIFPSTS
ncbi:uncharacterized protein [Aegilops tauschii subsp. strangulata]|uniref:uncharacterized protein n=1 Tax=Aegilops tauschii subsp. strangulata TaxID=200361 RepID=UPI003CC8AE5C